MNPTGLRSTKVIGPARLQLKIRLLMFTRAATNQKYKSYFKISSENSDRFGRLADIHLEYKDGSGNKRYKLVNIRHNTDDMESLYFTNRDDFNLSSYFERFLEIKKQCSTDDIENFVILTNLKLGDCHDLFEKVTENEELLACAHRSIGITPKQNRLKLQNGDQLFKLLRKLSTDDDLIKEFQSKFIILSGQPNEQEIDDVLIKELSTLSSISFVYFFRHLLINSFLDSMPDQSITNEDINIIITGIKTAYEKTNCNALNPYELYYDSFDPTIIGIRNFIENRGDDNFLIISTTSFLLTIHKIDQCINDGSTRCYLIMLESNGPDYNNQLVPIEDYKVCVIICKEQVDPNRILKRIVPGECKVIMLTPSTAFPFKDSLLFKQLASSSKPLVLSRKVWFNGRETPLNQVASIDFFDKLEDPNWLHHLVPQVDFYINKPKHIFDEKNYIERYVKLNFQIRKSETEIIAHSAKIVILSSRAGMGKTTLLPSLYDKIRKLDQSSWIEIIKLTDHIQVLPLYETYDDAIDFLSKEVLKCDSFSTQLFKHQLLEKSNAVIMFDAFDEISLENRKIVVRIIKKLAETNVKQIWVTTRPYQEFLEWQLSVRAWKLVKFSETNQIDALVNYWTKMGNKTLQSTAKSIVDKMEKCEVHMDIPLHTQMVAEFFLENHLNMNKELPSDFSRQFLYTNIIQRKYTAVNIDQDKYNDIHGKLAMKLLCPQIVPTYDLEQSEVDAVNSIGIAMISAEDSKICFVHKTYAEYFVAHFIFNKLNDCSEILDFLVKSVLGCRDYVEVKKFLNAFLDNTNFSESFLKRVRDTFLKYIKSTAVPNAMSMSITPHDNFNFLRMIYGAIKLLELVDLESYRNYFPNLLNHISDFKRDHSLLETILEENEEVMKYKLYHLQSILILDSENVLEKFLLAMQRQMDFHEIKKTLTMSFDFTEASHLFYMKKNCSNNFLSYLQDNIRPTKEFKKFVLMPNRHWFTFLDSQPEELLLWFGENVDSEFYQLLVKLKKPPSNLESTEDRFHYYYKEVIDSKIFDEVEFTQEMLVKASFFLKYDQIPAGILLDKMIALHAQRRESGKDLSIFKLNKEGMYKMTKRLRYGDLDFLVKFIRFVLVAYYSDFKDHEMNLGKFEEMVLAVCENSFEHQYRLVGWFHSLIDKMDLERYGDHY